MAITWQNINAPDFTASNRILESAKGSFNQSFGALSGIVKDGERRRDEGIDLRSQEFIDSLRSRYQTPEALRAAQASGEIGRLRANAGTLNPDKTGTGAVDGLIGRLQDRVTSDNAFNKSQLQERTQGNRDAFAELLFNKDYDGAGKLLKDKEFSNVGARFGELASSISATQAEERAEKARIRKERLENRAEERDIYRYNRQLNEDNKADAKEARNEELTNLVTNTYLGDIAEKENYHAEVKARTDLLKKRFGDYEDPTIFNSLSPTEKVDLDFAREEINALEGLSNPTDNRDALRKSLLEAGAKPEELVRAESTYAGLDLMQETISAREEQQNNQEAAALDSAYKSNPIVKGLIDNPDPNVMVQEVINELSPEFRENMGAGGIREIVNTLSTIAAEGFRIDGEGEPVPVTKNMIKIALENTDNSSIWFFDRSLKSTLTDVINNGDYSQHIESALEYKTAKEELLNRQSSRRFNPKDAVNRLNALDLTPRTPVTSAPRVPPTNPIKEESTEDLMNNLRVFR